MSLFHADTIDSETYPMPQDVLQEVALQGYDDQKYGRLKPLGVRWLSSNDGGGHVSWWFAEEIKHSDNVERGVRGAPPGWTTMTTRVFFDDKRFDYAADGAKAFIELVKQGVGFGMRVTHGGVVVDHTGELRTKWYVDMRPRADDRAGKADTQENHEEAAGDSSLLKNGDEGHDALAGRTQTDQVLAQKDDNDDEPDDDAEVFAETKSGSKAICKGSSANDNSIHRFPCPLPKCDKAAARRMDRRTLLIAHIRDLHKVDIYHARGGAKDKTVYNRRQNAQERKWLETEGHSWQGTIFADGA